MATAFNSNKVTTNPRPNWKPKEEVRNAASNILQQTFNVAQKDALIDAVHPDSKMYGPDGQPDLALEQ